jgi:aspartate aminotransferase-like enzyme
MAFLDEALGQLGLEPIVAPEHRSASVRALPLPEGIGYGELHDRLRDRGYVIYGGLGEAARTTFRVCAMGTIEVDALRGFATELEHIVSSARDPRARRGRPLAGAASR